MDTVLAIIFGSIVGLFALYPLVAYPFISNYIYKKHLKRASKEVWGRVCSEPSDYEQHLMWDEGIEWAKENEKYKSEHHIVNEGYNLYAEYFDFGFKKAVIFIAGRCESLCYGYYYGKAYKDAGYNLLFIDKRAHGLSDGEYEDCGQHSYIDLIAWAKYLKDNYDLTTIGIHGICIGSSTALFAMTAKEKPDYLKFMVADGMYTTFRDSFKRHMKKDMRSTLLVLEEICFWGKVYSGANFWTKGPKYSIKNMHSPILMIYSKLDQFSTPENGKKMFDSCPAEYKKYVLFEQGRHSHVRFNNPEKYDSTIAEFLEKID